jgi:hypothetical protein
VAVRVLHAVSPGAAVAILVAALAVDAGATTPGPTIDLARPRSLTASQIVDRNVAARGGIEAWRQARTMIWIGHLESAHAPDPRMGFVLAQMRPNKSRFELSSMNQKTWRIFDGEQGWKQRTDSDGRPDVQPFESQEVKFARQNLTIDAPLIDLDAHGERAELEGEEQLDGLPAYRLRVQLASGERRHVWVDAATFLDVRYDRTSYSSSGAAVTVIVRLRDFKSFGGLQIPTVIETGAPLKGGTPDRMVIEQVSINTPLDEQIFERPGSARRSRARDAVERRDTTGPASTDASRAAGSPASP